MKKLPILMQGEKLATPIEKKGNGGPKEFPYTYEVAKERTLANINSIKKRMYENKDEFLEKEVVVCVRMDCGFIAKSYQPKFWGQITKIDVVGARRYSYIDDVADEEKYSKLYFMKIDKDGLDKLEQSLKNDELNSTARKELQTLRSIDFLTTDEKLLGFEGDEQCEKVEIVLHPLEEDYEEAISRLKKCTDLEIQIRSYEKGPIFIEATLTTAQINSISNFNFLRTIHPLREIELPQLRSSVTLEAPTYNFEGNNAHIKIGVFDGGILPDIPLIKPFVVEHNLSEVEAEQDGLEHGTAVCGAVLFGELNKYHGKTIHSPNVLVESFRVLPDNSMYSIIDNIENVVTHREDINVYNISFGPRIPICDDQINRFTYSLDKLAYEHNKVFCIAVGNDGDAIEPFNRIQPPSDMVNGLGIGSFSRYDGDIYRANYSCVGLGREGGKIKPDVLDFGGDAMNFFHAVSTHPGKIVLIAGTSFASPNSAGKIGNILNLSNDIEPLIARTLLVHTADKVLDSCSEEGFGIVKEDIEGIAFCSENRVTLVYYGEINPKVTLKIPIPYVGEKASGGKCRLAWTISTLTDVNGLDTDGYTNMCLEDTFYPHSDKYNIYQPGKSTPLTINIHDELERLNYLQTLGYRLSSLPKSESPNGLTEAERRIDLKWDTIVKKEKNKQLSSLKEPFITVHAIPRNDDICEKVKFCIIVTTEIEKYEGNMYQDILEKYPVLTPLRLKVDQQVQVIQ